MKLFKTFLLLFCLVNRGFCAAGERPDHRMPPRGITVPPGVRADLEKQVVALGREIEDLRGSLNGRPGLLEFLPDVQIYYNAVLYALADDVFYRTNDFGTARKLLAEGRERAGQLRRGAAPWNTATGLVARGYVSKIDGSVQPYGLVVPPGYHYDTRQPYRLDFWFHGRGENLTELAFIRDRESKAGEFTPTNTLVLQPYGRYCNAYKFAGESDVFEALENVCRHYPVDSNRVSVRGFSMGGAATWHLAAHHAGLWAAASPGAGFVETAIYQKMSTRNPPPPWYEQKLWHLSNATDYAGNLFNCPVIAYSGGIDPQKQAADLMAQAMAQEGLTLTHIIGPNTGHKYEPRAKVEVARLVDAAANQGRDPVPRTVRFTTWTLHYNQMKWVTIDGLEQEWERARVNAQINDAGEIKADTTNVSALTFTMPAGLCPLDAAHPPMVWLDNQKILAPLVAADHSWTVHFQKHAGRWRLSDAAGLPGLVKRHGLQGPIDDAFLDSFIMVRPTGTPLDEKTGAWAARELTRAAGQWRLQFRGAARVKDDREITDADIAASNLILWGDPESNRVLKKIAAKLPIHWDAREIMVGAKNYPARDHAVVMIYPNPLNPKRYVVLNTGFTFSEVAHLSNALQVAQLPDYAVVDITVPLAERVPRGVVDAGFFNEQWALPMGK